MKQHLLKVIAILSLFMAASARSQNLDWASLTGSSIADSEGNVLNNSFVFQLGTFDPSFTPTESNMGDWASHWRVFDQADYSEENGYFTGSQNVQDFEQAGGDYSMFEGLSAYIWIRNPENSEYFLANAANWIFPDYNPECCGSGDIPVTWSISDLANNTPVWGGQNGNHSAGEYQESTGPFPHDIQTHAVPEPATLFLAVLGCSMMLGYRRRQM